MKVEINKRKTNSLIKSYYKEVFGWEKISLVTELIPHENSLLERVSFTGTSVPKYSIDCTVYVSGVVENNGIRVPISDTVTNSSITEIIQHSFCEEEYLVKRVSFTSENQFSFFKWKEVPNFQGITLEVEAKAKKMIR